MSICIRSSPATAARAARYSPPGGNTRGSVLVRFGICLGNTGVADLDAGLCLDIARHADRAGFDSVWVEDRPGVTSLDGPPLGSWSFDPLIIVSSLAVATEHLQVGALLGMPYRHPAIVAKMLAAADLLSEGRVILGVGAGHDADEFAALGLSPGHFARRGDVTDEYVRAVKEMWLNTGPSNFTGEFVAFADVGAFPKPLQKPHPPIVVAGDGDDALVRASRLGTGYMALALPPHELAGRVEDLRAACRRDRRDPDEVEVLLLAHVSLLDVPATAGRAPLTGTIDQVAEDLRQYARAGLDHLVIAATPGAGDLVDAFAAEILPAFGTARRGGAAR